MFKKTWDKCIVTFIVLALATVSFAKDNVEAFETYYEGDTVYLQPTDEFAGFTLKVSGNDVHYTQQFAADETPYVGAFDADGNLLADGLYKYEVIAAPVIDAEVREIMMDARAGDYEIDAPRGKVQSGIFRIVDGELFQPEEEEGLFSVSKDDSTTNDDSQGTPVTDADPDRAQVYATDVIVQGSECVGFDCATSESFGSDTLRLKENNLRIHFNDTSSSASFPANDWRISINDTTNGGADYFAIQDATGNKTPFKIEAGARNNALYVDDSGKVGVGTASPVLNFHIVEGNSPAMRLEQDGSSGFTPQTWDISGNEANFFVRDVTNGSKLPFKIKPSAPTDSLFVAADGDIGIGTASPAQKLHVESGNARIEGLVNVEAAGAQVNITDTTGSTGNRFLVNMSNAGNVKMAFNNTAYNHIWEYVVGNNGQFYLFKQGNTDHAMDIYGNGNVTIAGTLTENSDVNSKENIEAIDPMDVLHNVLEMPITTWNYKDTCDEVRHMGPMAQDFYSAFGLNGREDGITTIDTSGVALGAIQGLAKMVEAKDATIESLEQKLADQEARLQALEAALLK